MLYCFRRHAQVSICSAVMKKEEGYSRNMSYRRLENRDDSHKQRHPIQSVIVSSPDKALLITVAFLVIIGFMAIFSASAPKCIEEGGNPAQFLIKQLICFVVGFFGLKFFTNYDYKKLADWNLIFAGVIIVLLLLVDFTPLGVTALRVCKACGRPASCFCIQKRREPL